MAQLSTSTMRAMLSDEIFNSCMDSFKTNFIEGNRAALFQAITLCAQFQAVIPEWVTEELLKFDDLIFSRAKFDPLYQPDFNEFFDSDVPQPTKGQKVRYNKRKRIEESADNEDMVVSYLLNHRWTGGSLQAEMIRTIAAELELSEDVITSICKKNGIIKCSQAPEGVEIFASIKLPKVYRSGRPSLSEMDWEAKTMDNKPTKPRDEK
ncbi:MAG: hypothetical protein CMI01_08250 [Oceanospirillaceae bacterium]|nr:hypothetical protein [Oceanospirillaceae bacterium]